MIRFFSRLKHRKGFTLTEMIVVAALIGIIMASVAAISVPIRSAVRSTEARTNAVQINEVIGNYFERELAYANKIDVFVGYNITDSDISSKYDSEYKPSAGVDNMKVKVMACGFEERSEANHKKGTMRIYDKLMPSVTAAFPTDLCTEANAVFKDDFYAGYQYFITTDDIDGSLNANPRTRRAYMNLSITSFNCEEDGNEDTNTDAQNITSAMIINHYKYVDHSDSSVTEDPFAGDIVNARIGVENPSFTLENITANEINRIKTVGGNKQYHANGSPVWETYTTAPEYNIHRGNSGNDIVILYSVRTYTIDDL